MTLPPPAKDAVIAARRIAVRTPVTLRPGRRCNGTVTATVGVGTTLRRGTLRLATGVFNARLRCLASGYVTPARAPRVGQPVTVRGLTILKRVVRVRA